MKLSARDILSIANLDQSTPCIVETNFRFTYVEELYTERLLHGLPWAKLLKRRIPVRVTHILPKTVPMEPPLTLHELSQLEGITDSCHVVVDRLPRKCTCVIA